MSDGMRRSLAAIIGAGGIAYIAWMMSQQQVFVKDSLVANQMWVGIGFMVLFFLFILWLAIKPLAIKRLKWWVIAYSILVIFLGNYLLIDKAEAGVYAGDIVVLIGVLIFFLALTGALITKKVKQKIEHAMQEIIEV